MEVTVDSFSLLLDNIGQQYNEFKQWSIEIFAIVGAFYFTKLSLTYGSTFVYKAWVCYKHSKNRNFVKIYGRWAIITGCTSGIGKAFANELAAKGMNVCLIARDNDKLITQSRYLRRRYGAKTIAHVHNFNDTSPEAYAEIEAVVKDIEIGILINNVGIHYDHPMHLTEVPHTVITSMCQINIASSVLMTKLVAKSMMKRQQGLIINMSSGASWAASPLISTYSASKAFISSFSDSMNEELKESNIHVQCLEPLYIASGMTTYATILQKFSFVTPSSEKFARMAVCTFGNVNKTTGYYSHSLQRMAFDWVPSYVYRLGTMRWHKYLQREGKKTYQKEK